MSKKLQLPSLSHNPHILSTQPNLPTQHVEFKRVYNVIKERLPNLVFKSHPPLDEDSLVTVDLRRKCPPVYDQGNLGSCTANALVGSFQFDDPTWLGSRLFLYYNERSLDNHILDDAGSTLATGIKSLTTNGVCAEVLWPYDVSRFANVPPKPCYKNALLHKSLISHHVAQDKTSMQQALAAGFPIVVAFQVYESFESANVASTGFVPIPLPTEKCLGGHAVMCVGFDNTSQTWIMRNSWGADWGDNGYFYMPYEYLTDDNLASDLWVIKAVHVPCDVS